MVNGYPPLRVLLQDLRDLFRLGDVGVVNGYPLYWHWDFSWQDLKTRHCFQVGGGGGSSFRKILYETLGGVS